MNARYPSEIRDSQIRTLLEKVKKQSYAQYLLAIRLEKARLFNGAHIRFDFPVTALIGPNGGGKSTILGAAACAYQANTESFFPRNAIGDNTHETYTIEYEAVDKTINPKGSIKSTLVLDGRSATHSASLQRQFQHFNVSRTIPAIENSQFTKRTMRGILKDAIVTALRGEKHPLIESISITDIDSFENTKAESETILGKSLRDFRFIEATVRWRTQGTSPKAVRNIRKQKGDKSWTPEKKIKTTTQRLLIGKSKAGEFSEFNFGAGESSILRLVHTIESLPDHSLVLIEELENGLHPVAARRLVEYLINSAERKKLQIIFTTHSDATLTLLPPEAIWAAIDGKVQQGKLSVDSLRAVTGRIDQRLAIFVEDDFAKHWVESVLRDSLGMAMEEVGVYAVGGDGNAVAVHKGHRINPSLSFKSICLIDGDSAQKEDAAPGIYRLPGTDPESTVFNSILAHLDQNIALLTAACQRPLSRQDDVAQKVKYVSHVCRDPHNLFSRLGMELGFMPEAIVRGAFFSVWISQHPELVKQIIEPIQQILSQAS
jgi:Fe-S cluster assembly ATPase SufC